MTGNFFFSCCLLAVTWFHLRSCGRQKTGYNNNKKALLGLSLPNAPARRLESVVSFASLCDHGQLRDVYLSWGAPPKLGQETV